MTEQYRIVSLVAENVKKLKLVEIKPGDAPVVEITGKNGNGKTSVLDAIWWALTGAENIQAVPIRKGQDEARIELNLGPIIVRRTFRKKGDTYPTSVTVESADGARYNKPQTLLDTLLDTVALDPLRLMRMDAKDRFNELRSFVPGIDFDEIAGKRRALYEMRTEQNRIAAREQAAADLIKVPPEAKRIDEQPLVDRLAEAAGHNATLQQRIENRKSAELEVEAADSNIAQVDQERTRISAAAVEDRREMAERHDREMAELQLRHADEKARLARDIDEDLTRNTTVKSALLSRIEQLRTKLANAGALPAPIDEAAIRAELDRARAMNQHAARAEQQKEHLDRAKIAAAASKDLTLKIEALDEAKATAIAAAKLPVEGLDFGDGTVIFNGVPLDQASDAEQLRVCVALAMAASPKLRVIRIRDGSLLDDDAMKLLTDMARERDYQVWIERVDSSGKVGFVLEDGAIVHRPGEEGSLL
jgi:DNA repair exonuclease SbcCD ATPase subunit